MSNQKSLRRLEPARKKAERHGVTVRTLNRWEAEGIIDPAVRIHNRKYYEEENEPRLDQNTEAVSKAS
jgi:DNA-binding transcriptional MerR regulator